MPDAYLTVTLTRRPPVRIDPALWPIIATSRARDINCTQTITVRHGSDDRVLVYGVNLKPGQPDRRRGHLLDEARDSWHIAASLQDLAQAPAAVVQRPPSAGPRRPVR